MVGFFDSGTGGLTVLKAARQCLPDIDMVYVGDTARSPYGSQHPDTILRYAREAAAFLQAQGATIMVIACNTASAVAADILRQELDIPVFDVSAAAVLQALAVTKSKRIGVIGTRTTIASKTHERLLLATDPRVKVFAAPTPLLAPLVEERAWRYPETMRILRRYLRPLKDARIDTLILGCTHYPMIEKQIQRVVGKRVRLVSSADALAEVLRTYITANSGTYTAQKGKLSVFTTGDVPHFAQTARWWLGEAVEVKPAVL